MSKLQKLVLGRLIFGILTLFVVSALMFIGIELLPGDLAQQILGQSATPETASAFRAELGLDQPAYIRYADWLGGIVRGDFGSSLASGRPVADLLGTRLANTMFLAVYAAAIAVPIALILGLMAALWRNTLFDRGINIAALSAVSMPGFFVAYVLILFFSIRFGWFPTLARIDTATSFGARNTVGLALLTTGIAFGVGAFLGMLAALRAGWLDQVLSRMIDVLMSVPPLIVALMLLAIVGTSISNMIAVIAVIAVIYVAPVYRLSRAAAMNVTGLDYVEAARLRGESTFRLLWREILPKIGSTLIAEFGVRFCFVFLFIAALSFLGIGIQPPTAD